VECWGKAPNSIELPKSLLSRGFYPLGGIFPGEKGGEANITLLT
jgi:hypothetical protein